MANDNRFPNFWQAARQKFAFLSLIGSGLLASCLLTPALAEPLSLKGISPGSTKSGEIAQIAAALEMRYKCSPVSKIGAGDELCFIGPATLATRRVYAFSVSNFREDVVAVRAEVKEEDTSFIAAALTEKFGEPLRTEIVKSNALGAEFRGEQYTWHDGQRTLTLKSLDSKVGSGSIMLTHHGLLKMLDELARDAAAKSADDL